MLTSPASLVVMSWCGLAIVVILCIVALFVIARFSRRRRALAKMMHEEGFETGQTSSEATHPPRHHRGKRRWEGEWGLDSRAKVTFVPAQNVLDVRLEPSQLPCEGDMGWLILPAAGKEIHKAPEWTRFLQSASQKSPNPFPGYVLKAPPGTPILPASLLHTLRPYLMEAHVEWSIAASGECVWVHRRGSRPHAAWPDVKAVLEAVEAVQKSADH